MRIENELFLLFAENRPQGLVEKPDDAPDKARDTETESSRHGGSKRGHYSENGSEPFGVAHAAVDDVPSGERDAFPLLVEEVGVDLGRALDGLARRLQSHVAELQVLGVRGADPGREPDL